LNYILNNKIILKSNRLIVEIIKYNFLICSNKTP